MHVLRYALSLVGLLVGGMMYVTPAQADLRVCNQTSNPVSIALGYRAARGWMSEGWWIALPEQCATVFQGALDTVYYYLYVADDIGGGAWDGGNFMCTRDETFSIFGVEECLARGYERTGFFEIDTQGREDWMVQLTDPVVGDLSGTDDEPMGPDEPAPADAPAESTD